MTAKKSSPKPAKKAVLPAQNANDTQAGKELRERVGEKKPASKSEGKSSGNAKKGAVLPAQHANER